MSFLNFILILQPSPILIYLKIYWVTLQILSKFGPKIKILVLSQGGAHFSCFICFGWKHPFLDKFGPKNQNCQFRQKFVTKTNLNMQNLEFEFRIWRVFRFLQFIV